MKAKSVSILPKNAQKIYDEIVDALNDLETFRDIEEISELSGISFVTIYKWRKDPPMQPRLNTFFRLAEALGYEIVMRKAVRGQVQRLRAA